MIQSECQRVQYPNSWIPDHWQPHWQRLRTHTQGFRFFLKAISHFAVFERAWRVKAFPALLAFLAHPEPNHPVQPHGSQYEWTNQPNQSHHQTSSSRPRPMCQKVVIWNIVSFHVKTSQMSERGVIQMAKTPSFVSLVFRVYNRMNGQNLTIWYRWTFHW